MKYRIKLCLDFVKFVDHVALDYFVNFSVFQPLVILRRTPVIGYKIKRTNLIGREIGTVPPQPPLVLSLTTQPTANMVNIWFALHNLLNTNESFTFCMLNSFIWLGTVSLG